MSERSCLWNPCRDSILFVMLTGGIAALSHRLINVIASRSAEVAVECNPITQRRGARGTPQEAPESSLRTIRKLVINNQDVSDVVTFSGATGGVFATSALQHLPSHKPSNKNTGGGDTATGPDL